MIPSSEHQIGILIWFPISGLGIISSKLRFVELRENVFMVALRSRASRIGVPKLELGDEKR